MGHTHDHHHHHHHDLKGRSLLWTILLNVLITVAQLIGAFISNSLSLLTDALHNFSDVMALVISFIANRLSNRKYSEQRSFGYKRAEILAAFINAATLLAISCYLIVEASRRLVSSEQPLVDGMIVMILAGISILANGLSVLLVKKHAENNMNMHSAYLHLFSDMLSSIAVLLGGIVMHFWHIQWVDAVLSVGIAIYLIVSSWKLFVKTLKVLMQFAPAGIDIAGLAQHIEEVDGIKNIHHVHVWQLNDDELHLEAHVDFDTDVKLSEANSKMLEVEQVIKEHCGITHITLQPEFNRSDDKSLVGKQGDGCGC